ncbi:DUF885 domain-containing protein [Sorangium sp. So ce341]|uniref:DUF885 domain-containing protein n=1 Tax=Sorangium sp. So ce341 TaxID=3133302 RepID=UPI003F5DB21C
MFHSSRTVLLSLALFALTPLACTEPRSPAAPGRTETQGSTAAARLAALAGEHWEGRLAAEPVEATFLGFRSHDDRLPDVTEAGRAREIARLEALLGRARAIDAASLALPDRVTHGMLVHEIESDLARRRCDLSAWTVDQLGGPQVELFQLARVQTVRTVEEGRALVARWSKIGAYMDARTDRLRRALEHGKVAPRATVERVIAQLDELLAKPSGEWALMSPRDAAHPDWPEAEQRSFAAAVEQAVEGGARPAFSRYREALAREILPRARDHARAGLSHVPGGEACYARLIQASTSLALSADEVHAIGLEQVARIRDEMKALGAKALGTSDFAEIQRRLREDKALTFSTRDEVEAAASSAVARARAALPAWLGALPRTPLVVQRMEAFEEKHSPPAFYRDPAQDGSRPGTYFVNTHAPETRRRFESEVVAFHEAIPGHHVQVSLAQELGEVPAFRKHANVMAFTEGWGLYSERLADEMGLYSSDLDRLGMLSADAWRACRLVLDTGIHAKGWSRAQAVTYMLENTIVGEGVAVNEVDRYIGWPGQALAYKVGQLEIQRLRRDAEQKLGPRFDIKGFHDALLGAGAVTLPILGDQIARWVASRARLP